MFTRPKVLFFVLSILLIQFNIYGQVIENIEPTTAQFPIVRGSGDPDYNGDLNVNIPLMTIPSRDKLKYDLNLIYVMGNGVPASESSSWVGLGWNINLPQITCSPAYSYQNSPFWIDGNDTYYLSLPNYSTPIYKFADGIWRPLKWSAIKIAPKDTTNIDGRGYKNDIKQFVITDVDGTQYIFSNFLFKQSPKRLRNHCDPNFTNCPHHPHHPYRYVFKLCAILGPDYVDGSTPQDSIPENGGIDKGNWIKFDYSNPYFINDYASGDSMQVNYLTSIKTPTHEAIFSLSENPTHSFIYMGQQNISKNLKSLEAITLQPRNGNDDPRVKLVEFNTTILQSEGAFSWAKYISDNTYQLIKTPTSNTLRLRLNSVQIYGTDHPVPSYKFDYYQGPNEANNASCWEDPWGFYSIHSNYLSFYTDSTNQDITDWMLKNITYPSGAVETFTYEEDRFQAPSAIEDATMAFAGYGGGVRLKTRSMNSFDFDSTTYSYEYSLTNYQFPGCGFLSAWPCIVNQVFGVICNSVGFNLNYDVHYPDIKIIEPDGNHIQKFYTSAFSGVTGNPLGNKSIRYSCYHYSYDSVFVKNDPFVESYNVTDSDPVHTIFHNSDTINYPSYRYITYNRCYYNETEAFRKEFSEYDDLNNGGNPYFQLYNNSWKRGYLTREEFYNQQDYSGLTPIHAKIYSYNMIPIKTEPCNYRQGNGVTTFPGFITSGWVQQTMISTQNLPSYNISAKKEEMKYDSINGLIKIYSIKKGEGNQPSTTQRTYYAYAYKYPEYSGMLNKNMLSQKTMTVVGDGNCTFSDTLQNNLNIASLNYTQWKDTLSGLTNQWYPWKTYCWLDTNNNKSCSQSELIKTVEIQSYDQYGNVLKYIDNNSTPTTAQWDYTSSYPVAITQNALPGECSLANLETGSSNWEANWTQLSETMSFTGKKSAYCANAYGPTKNFYDSTTGINTSKSYVADAWIYRGTGGVAKITIEIRNPSGQYVSDVNSLISTGSGWQYIRRQIDPSAMTSMTIGWYLRVSCGFNGINNSGWVDDVRFYPLTATMTTSTIDSLTRQLTSKSDANNVPIKYEVDALGCLQSVLNAEDSTLINNSYYYSRLENGDEYNQNDPNYIQSISMPYQFNKIIATSFYDHLGREIQTQVKDSLNSSLSSTSYDEMSRILLKSEPFLATTNNEYYPSSGDYNTDFVYDVLGRTRQLCHPDNSLITYLYYVDSYYKDCIKTTNELGIKSMETFDHFGNKSNIVNGFDTSDTLHTEFQTDILGHITKVLPPNYFRPPRSTSATNWDDIYKKYDTLGRLVEEYTQDADTVRYIYDNNNNLRFKQDKYQFSGGKYDFTAYVYDKQNRLILVGEETGTDWTSASPPSITGDFGTGASEWKIRYTYDVNQAGVTNFCQGKLTMVEFNENTDNYAENVIKFVYDKFGYLAQKLVTMSGQQSANTIKFYYDILGREIQIDYPSGNKVSKTYDSVGRLKKIIALQ